MSGNIEEFVFDGYTRYSPRRQVDPVVTSSLRRVARGGSYDNVPENLRVAIRDSLTMSEKDEETGFRLARNLALEEASRFDRGAEDQASR